MYSMALTNEEILIGDWTKGTAGSGENDFVVSLFDARTETGCLAESFEFPDPNTAILHIRKGVHWGLNPSSEASRLVNGRELVAEDVAYSIRRAWSKDFPLAWIGRNYPGWLQSATATDKWTVVIKGNDQLTRMADVWERLSEYLFIVPPEVVAKYKDLRDWKNSVGTGPFFLTDYVSGSSFTFVRNPNYWMKDPIGPGKGNQLPYLDGAKFLVLADPSTRLAALRTGKIDVVSWYCMVYWDSAKDLITGGKLKYVKSLANAQMVFMRTDLPPYNDIRVRKALHMAIDFQGIARDMFRGDATIISEPVAPYPAYMASYTSYEQLPPETKEMFDYHPDKAKQLLAEAGYPNGFKTTMPADNNDVRNLDMAAVLQNYWSKIGVDVEIQPLDDATFTTQAYAHTYKGLIFSGRAQSTAPHFESGIPGHQYNESVIDDPYINEKLPQIWAWENIGKEDIRAALLKDINLRYLGQAYDIPIPNEYGYYMWWPWLKNYHGESAVGLHTLYNFFRWTWVDQELKKEMGY